MEDLPQEEIIDLLNPEPGSRIRDAHNERKRPRAHTSSNRLPRLAQGTGNFRYTNNDFAGGGKGGNAFGWRAEGTLDDLVNGGRARYTEEQTALFLPDGTFKEFLVENIFLRHIGGR
jgi:hypothetical protein